MSYFSTHNHTDYSNLRLLDSTNKVKGLIDRAIELGLTGLAITDHESLSSHVKVDRYRKKLIEDGVIDEDFTIALGDEVYLVDNLEKKQQYYHFILVAKDEKGYEQLTKISSQAWENSYYDRGMERVPITLKQVEDIIGDDKGHLIASTACLGGLIPNTLLKLSQGELSRGEAQKRVSNFIDWNLNIFGEDNFFFELQVGDSQEQSIVNRMMIGIANSRNINTIITTDSHYLSKEDRDVHRAFLHSQEGDREVDAFYEFTYMMGVEEIKEILSEQMTEEEINIALENTNIIKNNCNNIDLHQEVDITKVDVSDFKFTPEEKNRFKEYKYIDKYLNSSDIYDRALIGSTIKGIEEKSDVDFTKDVLDRVNIELEHILGTSERIGKNLSNYLLTTRELVNIMWEEGDSLVGPSRGSATGLMINYLIDIIQVNPMRWKIPWWRFLHKDRPDMMDIDLDSQKSQRGQILQALYDRFGEDKVLNIATFGKMGSKSAILSACRGLNIDDSTAHFLTGMIPEERGANWSLSDCLYGNEDKERRPQEEFIAEVNNHADKKLREVMLAFEGLIDKRSIHASGIYIYNKQYFHRNAMMISPGGVRTTQFDMGDSDYRGGVKFDFLTVEILDKIRGTMNHLLEKGDLEWQGSLRKTYNKYLFPSELEYENEEMWKMASEGRVVSLFQFDSPQGGKAIREVGPVNLVEMAAANSLMRLASKGSQMQPLEKYIKYRNNIELWYEEMFRFGLNDKEIEIMKEQLGWTFGIAATQEDLMELVMDENIAGFTVVEAHKARKAIAKKKPKLLKQFKEDFFKRAEERTDARAKIIDYVWNFCIVPQMGYSFSRNHTLPYSMIALQILNLVHKYNKIAWIASCLTVESGALDIDSDKTNSTDYGEIAVAISNLAEDVRVLPPDINKSGYTFTPDFETDEILFGLKGLTYVGDNVVEEIIEKRPYITYEDFMERIPLSKRPIISLIKSNSFRNVCEKDRETLLYSYIEDKANTKTSLSLRNMGTLFSGGLFKETEVYEDSLMWYLRKVLRSEKSIMKKDLEYFPLNDYGMKFLEDREEKLKIVYIEDKYCVESEAFENSYSKSADRLREFVKDNEEELIKKLNKIIIEDEAGDYLEGGIGKWEMDSISYYATENELDYINYEKYSFIDKYEELEIKPVKFLYKDKYPVYNLSHIVGTCLARNKTKGSVKLLTRSGVVTVKFKNARFAYYDKQVKKNNSIIDTSFFSRGNKVIITGYRSGEKTFRGKTYSRTRHSLVYLIEKVDKDGSLELRSEKYL